MSSMTKIDKKPIRVLYKNYRGETAWRTIIPKEIFFGCNDYHKEDQWLVKVQDMEKGAERIYAMSDIQEWRFS